MSECTQQFVTLFLAASRKLERILLRLHPLLTVDQSYVLSEIEAAELQDIPITAQEITEQLKIEKSTLSRLLGRLADAHMLTFSPNPLDRRERLLGITEVGRKFLARDLSTREQQIEEFGASLSSTELEILSAFLRIMADSLNQPEIPENPGDHPLKAQIRRLTRALGFLGGTLFGSGVSLEESQMLSLLSEHPGGLPRMILKENLPYDQTRISRLISKYEENGILSRAIHPEDRRQYIISLGETGRKRLAVILSSADTLFKIGLKQFNENDRQAFLSLLERAVAEPEQASPNEESLPEGIVVLKSEMERKQARAFLISYLTKAELLEECGETLIGQTSRTYALVENGAFVVLMEAVHSQKSWQIVHFAEAEAIAPVFDVFVALCRDLFVRQGADRLDISSIALRHKFSAAGTPLSVTDNTWEDAAMKLSSRRLDA